MKITDFDGVYLPQVAEIEKSCFTWEANSENALRDYLQTGFGVVAVEGDEVVGFALCYRGFEEGQIVSVVTKPEWRQKGVGKMLMEELERRAKQEGMLSLSLEVREGNAPARTLYEKMGFSVNGIRKNFYKEPIENAVIMVKMLS